MTPARPPDREPAWDDYRLFHEVCRGGSLARAAAATGLDKSTVSRRLARLEARLGVALLTRTREGLQPTEAARRLLARLEPVAQVLAGLDAGDLGPEEGASGLVRVAVTEALAPFVVETALAPLLAGQPALSLEIVAGNATVNLARGEADLALRVVEPAQQSLRRVKLGALPAALYASRGYLSARGRPRKAGELRGHDVLLPSGELARLPEAAWLAARPGVRAVLRSNSMPALVQAASLDRGIVALVEPWARRVPALERLLAVPGLPPRHLWLVLREDAAGRRAVRAVADAISARMRAALG